MIKKLKNEYHIVARNVGLPKSISSSKGKNLFYTCRLTKRLNSDYFCVEVRVPGKRDRGWYRLVRRLEDWYTGR